MARHRAGAGAAHAPTSQKGLAKGDGSCRSTNGQPCTEQMHEVIGAEPLRRYTASATREGYMPQPGYRPLNKSDNRDLAFGHAAWSFVLKRI